MEEEDSFKLIEKYKSRLNRNNEFKKVLRALQRLNEVDMTIELLQATGIGKVVNSLRKQEGLGDFAKEIVNKWKKLLKNGVSSADRNSEDDHLPRVKNEPVEYDPTGNWEVSKQEENSSSYVPASVKREQVEYDPTQNWKMKKNSQNNSKYVPSPSPTKVKHNESKSKRKKHENNVASSSAEKNSGSDRELELRAVLEKAQRELKKIKQKKNKNPIKVKVEKSPDESPTRSSVTASQEYDPQCNYEDKSPLPYDPGSPGSGSEYEPSAVNNSIEYDPGPGNSNVDYRPSSQASNDRSPKVNDRQSPLGDDSYDEDEPGAYLLHPKRVSVEKLRNQSSEGVKSSEEEDSAESSFVLSTTIYSRNKSIDSEESWGSGPPGFKGHLPNINELPNEKEDRRKGKSKHETNSNDTKTHKKHKETGKAKIKTDANQKQKKVRSEKPESDEQSTSKHKESGKRKSTGSKSEEPVKKKVKNLSDKSEKKKPKDAGFLFEDIPVTSKSKKKKKKRSSDVSVSKLPKASEPPRRHSVKLDLHLPEIQTTYRPLPHSSARILEKKVPDNQLTDNQAAELHSQRQTKKMLVYSGGGGGFLPKMMSLFDQCMSVLKNNIDAIDVIGGIPYEIIHPVLERCTPEQLYRIEDSNPYLLEDTDNLWKKHSNNEFKGKRPDELESWREMFLRLHDEREAKLQSLTMMIQAKEAKKKPLEKKVLLAYVGTNAKAPRNVRKAQEKYGTGLRRSSAQPQSSSRSSTSYIRQELVDSRMHVPVGAVTAANCDRQDRFSRMKEMKKPKVAPMMAKTLKSIGRLRLKR